MRFEDFEYNGAAILERANGNGIKRLLEGVAAVSGQLGREVTDSPDPAIVDFVSLSGIFTTNAPIPADFVSPFLRVKNGYKLSLTGEGGIPTALLCTVERTEDERSVKILHAGY